MRLFLILLTLCCTHLCRAWTPARAGTAFSQSFQVHNTNDCIVPSSGDATLIAVRCDSSSAVWQWKTVSPSTGNLVYTANMQCAEGFTTTTKLQECKADFQDQVMTTFTSPYTNALRLSNGYQDKCLNYRGRGWTLSMVGCDYNSAQQAFVPGARVAFNNDGNSCSEDWMCSSGDCSTTCRGSGNGGPSGTDDGNDNSNARAGGLTGSSGMDTVMLVVTVIMAVYSLGSMCSMLATSAEELADKLSTEACSADFDDLLDMPQAAVHGFVDSEFFVVMMVMMQGAAQAQAQGTRLSPKAALGFLVFMLLLVLWWLLAKLMPIFKFLCKNAYLRHITKADVKKLCSARAKWHNPKTVAVVNFIASAGVGTIVAFMSQDDIGSIGLFIKLAQDVSAVCGLVKFFRKDVRQAEALAIKDDSAPSNTV